MIYAKRDARALGDHYTRHVEAMTAEGLHAKSAIAAELAWRDQRIEALEVDRNALREALKGLRDAYIGSCAEQRGGAMPLLRVCWALGLCHIDRWSGPHRGQYAAVWMAGEGEDCPTPERGA